MNGLTVDEVTKRYGRFTALGGISFTVEQGSCLGVVGPNGAGKSTLFAIIAGQIRPDSGSVLIDGTEVTRFGASKRATQGLSRTFQVARLFSSFTVNEAVVLACQRARRRGVLSRDPMRHRPLREKTRETLELIRLENHGERKVQALTQGERKRLEFGMAMAQDPRVLVLDEPTAGMGRSDVETVMDVLSETKRSKSDLTILLSSHDMDVVFGLADRMVVMTQGTLLVEGDPREVANDQRVADVYLGQR